MSMKISVSFIAAALGIATLVPTSSAFAQDRIQSPEIRIGCLYLGGLANQLDRLRDERQVQDSDPRVFKSKSGCDVLFHLEIVASRFLGWYDTGTYLVPIHRVEYDNGQKGWRPDGAFSKRFFSLPDVCWRSWTEDKDFKRIVRIYGRRGQVATPGCGNLLEVRPRGSSEQYRESPRRGRRGD